ncbi:MAG: hypothetical protein K8R23_15080 [Chthoniobacter sp.]|nr:hypothetical protein [Chthoniobacter sp.]
MNDHDPLLQGEEMQLYEPDPNARYNLDDAARLIGVSRRLIVLCCKYGLISTVVDPVPAGWSFDGRTVRVLRRVEALRAVCAGNLPVIRMVLKLQAEVERLDTELRFSRRQSHGK